MPPDREIAVLRPSLDSAAAAPPDAAMPYSAETTIAELAARGYTHIETRCADHRCGTKDTPFGLLKASPATTLAELRIKLRCEKCGERPASVQPWRQDMAPWYAGRQ